MTTPRLGLQELIQNQSQPHVPVNTALRRLDILAQTTVLDKDLTAPPGSPSDGDAYIVGDSATGAWSGKDGQIAYRYGGWQYIVPFFGMKTFVEDEDTFYKYTDNSPGSWTEDSGGGGGGAVTSVAGRTGAVVLTAEDLTDLGVANGVASLDGSGKVPSGQSLVASVAGRTGVVVLTAEDLTDLGAANGVASLDGSGKVPTAQLPSSIVGAVSYQGTWNANTNSPDLGASSPAQGYYYVVATAGATSLGGITDWKIGDWAIYNGSAWEKVDNTEDVTSVAGRTGAVVITSTDLADFAEAAQDAIGAMLADSTDMDFTYTDITPEMTAIIKANAVTYAKMQQVSATARVLGRKTAGAGNVEELSASDLLTLLAIPIEYQVALSDMSTDITSGTTKGYMRAPRAFTLTAVRASLATASSSGLPTVDINVNGSTILSTKLTIDATEKTSVTAATAAVITGAPLVIADDDLIEFDIDVAGTGAKGLIVTLIGHA